MIITAVLCGLVGLVLHLYTVSVLRPRMLRSKLQRQGIRGPAPSFLVGNIPDMKRIEKQVQSESQLNHDNCVIAHDWPARVFPYLQHWQKEYGRVFTYSVGNLQHLCVTDPEMVKEISMYTSLDLGKPGYLSTDRGPLLGKGIISSSGPSWAYQRKIIAPQFYVDKVKGMVNLMVESTAPMLRSWEGKVVRATSGYAEIRVDEDLRCLSADIISRASFGSNYSQGKAIFSKLREVQLVMSKGTYGVPGLRHVPTKSNREIWRLDREINSSILEVVKERSAEGECEKDLLQVILETAKRYGEFEDGQQLGSNPSKFIVDNCKNIYFAGHETTSTTASWCLVLLAAHQDWQSRCRAEVLETCKDGNWDPEMLRSMKALTMVIQETLRLYPPGAFLVREAFKDIKFKDIELPKGILLWVPVPTLHQDPIIWGADVCQFNPERFAQGTMRACKVPQVYLPFGLGPRVCAGQHFAMMELKIILSLLLSKFQFSLSPLYHHSPAFRLMVEPEHGVYLHVTRV